MISVTILTKNSSKTLPATLASVQKFPEIVIVDTGSTDKTVEIAKGCKVFLRPLEGFGSAHNMASSLATHDWILSIDSDETLSPELVKEILALPLDSNAVYAIHRNNYFNGKQIKCCSGWYPDWVVRLYNRKTTRFSDDTIHERILNDGLTTIRLHSPLLHTPYPTRDDLSRKREFYSHLFAEQHRYKKRSSFFRAFFHGAFAFFKSYFLKWGFLGGKEGWILSVHNSRMTFSKYCKLAKLSKKKYSCPP